MRVGAQGWCRGFVWVQQALQTQHLLLRSWPRRNPVGARGCLQGQKASFPIRVGEVGPVLLCGFWLTGGRGGASAQDIYVGRFQDFIAEFVQLVNNVPRGFPQTCEICLRRQFE